MGVGVPLFLHGSNQGDTAYDVKPDYRKSAVLGTSPEYPYSSAVTFTHFQRVHQSLRIEAKVGAAALIKPVRGNQMDM